MRTLIALNELIPPQQAGGSQKTALEVAAGLIRRGDEVSLAGRLHPRRASGVTAAVSALSRCRFHA